MMGGFGFGGMLFGGLMMLVFWVLVVGGVIWLVVTLARGGQAGIAAQPNAGRTAPGQTPLDVLKMRYAQGDISKEQFEQLKRDLGA